MALEYIIRHTMKEPEANRLAGGGGGGGCGVCGRVGLVLALESAATAHRPIGPIVAILTFRGEHTDRVALFVGPPRGDKLFIRE